MSRGARARSKRLFPGDDGGVAGDEKNNNTVQYIHSSGCCRESMSLRDIFLGKDLLDRVPHVLLSDLRHPLSQQSQPLVKLCPLE